jgi:hypothetical protein
MNCQAFDHLLVLSSTCQDMYSLRLSMCMTKQYYLTFVGHIVKLIVVWGLSEVGLLSSVRQQYISTKAWVWTQSLVILKTHGLIQSDFNIYLWQNPFVFFSSIFMILCVFIG